MGRTGAGAGDLVPARGGVRGDEMAAPGAAFPRQPGRRAGHRHPVADPGEPTAGRRLRHCAPPCTGMPSTPGGAAVLPGRTRPARWPGRERASLPLSQLADPRVIRAVLDGLCTRLDGSPAAASTITRKRSVFHGALGYAVELGLLPANPADLVRWRAPRAAVAVNPATVPSPAQVGVILAEVARIRPELAAFFDCLYYAALRPEEAVALRRADLILPARGRGTIILTTACRAPAPPGPAPAPPSSRGVSSTAPTAPSASSPSRRSWYACSASTCMRSGPRRTGGCSAAPAAACSASRSTAAPGTPPAGRPRPRPGRHRARPPPLRAAARRPVTVAQRHRHARRGRRPGRDQHPCPA